MKRPFDFDDIEASDSCKRSKEAATTSPDVDPEFQEVLSRPIDFDRDDRTTETTTTTRIPETITIRSSEPFDGGEYRRTLTIPIYDGSMEIDAFCRSIHDTMQQRQEGTGGDDGSSHDNHSGQEPESRDILTDDAFEAFRRRHEIESLRERIGAAESEAKSLSTALESKQTEVERLIESLDDAQVEISRLESNVRGNRRHFEKIQRCHTQWLDRAMRTRDDQIRRFECELQRLRAQLCFKNAEIGRLNGYLSKEPPPYLDLCEVCLDGYQT